MQYFVHESSLVDPEVSIGDNTKIWHFSHVMSGAQIGENCILGQNVFVGQGVRIGNNVKIQNNVSIYTGVELEDDVFIGPSVVFTNVVNPRAFIERKDEFRPTSVGKGSTIGANATIICGNNIGEYAMVAAAAVVTKDVLPYALVVGSPAYRKNWICQCASNIQLNNKKAVCPRCQRKYYLDAGNNLIFDGQ